MTEQSKGRGVPVWVFIVTIVAVALVVGIGAWLVAGLRPQVPASGTTATSTATVPATTTATAVATGTTVATATPSAEDATTTSATLRQLTLIKSISGSSTTGYTIKLDYLSDLTGTKAGEEWAKAHGEEWPPPNDYYFVNESTKVRTFAVSAHVSITLSSPGGNKELHPTMAQLRSHLLTSGDMTYSGSEYFWATITGGTTVTKIVQQWVP
jgi:hypothetical protein